MIRSIIFTESHSLLIKEQQRALGSALMTVATRCHPHAFRLICGKYCALSVGEAEASWPRPEESGRAWVGKAQYRGGPAMPASLCGPAMPCEMTGRVTQRPEAFFPL